MSGMLADALFTGLNLSFFFFFFFFFFFLSLSLSLDCLPRCLSFSHSLFDESVREFSYT